MREILYELDGALYANITNKCVCSCDFCIREKGTGVGSSQNLWLNSDATEQEVKSSLIGYDLSKYKEFVFCGYGEPTCALDVLIDSCKIVRSMSDIPIRINTNGLCDLINSKPVSPQLNGLVDTVSISLNASNSEDYLNITHSVYGERSFDAALNFASECKRNVSNVVFTVVDVIGQAEIQKCKNIADAIGIPLRVRKFIQDSTAGH